MLERISEPFQHAGAPAQVQIAATRRLRQSPYTHLATAAGASIWTIYNHMLLPVAFRSQAEDYAHLKRAVQVWDVAAERQVEISGPDATRLVQLMTPRKVVDVPTLRCLYAPICDAMGGMLNDPLIVRPDEERWWISIADTDILAFAKGIAGGLDLDVRIEEPPVYPLAVQGPLANDLMERVFGPQVRDLKFFRAAWLTDRDGTEHLVARCGWSGQGGFEVFVEGRERCEPLWNALFEEGPDLDVRAGCPNGIERIEAGLLSYGNDMTVLDDPYQCGLGRYVDPEAECLAKEALAARIVPDRQLRGLLIEGEVPTLVARWRVDLAADGETVGHVTSAANSPDLGHGIGIAMLDQAAMEPRTEVRVVLPGGEERPARVATLPLVR